MKRFVSLLNVVLLWALLVAACSTRPTVEVPASGTEAVQEASAAPVEEASATPAQQEEGDLLLDPELTDLEKLDDMLSLVLALATHPEPEVRETLSGLADLVELQIEGDPSSDPLRVGAFLVVTADLVDPAGFQRALGEDVTELFGPILLDDGTLLYSGAVAVYPGTAQEDQPLSRIAQLEGVLRLEVSYIDEQDLDISTGNSATPGGLWRGIDALSLHAWGLRGQGAIVAILDTGIDWAHPEFWTRGAGGARNTRILYLWDQYLQPNVATDVNSNGNTLDPGEAMPGAGFRGEQTPSLTVQVLGLRIPMPFSWGVEYTQAQINDSLGGAPAAPRVQLRSYDLDGHGTAVAGVAAGDGSTLAPAGLPGVAPEASLLVVKKRAGQRYTLQALVYVFDRATTAGMPAVVNYSWGSTGGPSDGTTSFDRAIARLLGAGKIMVKSAGNEGDDSRHAENDGASVAPAATLARTFIVPPNTRRVTMNVWSTAANNARVGVRYRPLNLTFSPWPPLANMWWRGAIWNIGGTRHLVGVRNYTSGPNPPGDHKVSVAILGLGGAAVASGQDWELQFGNRAAAGVAADGHFDAYITGGATFAQPSAEETISDPGNGASVVTVGAFVHYDANPANEGRLADFSSRGPARDISTNLAGAAGRPGRRKPDVTAPGSRALMPRSRQGGYARSARSPSYTEAGGTSFAAPHATGCIAIMLTANPTLTPANVQGWLPTFSRLDAASVVGNEWGQGKLWCGCDQDGDGVPLLAEDTNLNGVVDVWETSDDAPDSDGDGWSDADDWAPLEPDFPGGAPVETLWPGESPVDDALPGDEAWDFIVIDVPPDAAQMSVSLSGPDDSDFDLLIRRGILPTLNDFDEGAYSARSEESVTLEDPVPGRWYLGIRSARGHGDYRLSWDIETYRERDAAAARDPIMDALEEAGYEVGFVNVGRLDDAAVLWVWLGLVGEFDETTVTAVQDGWSALVDVWQDMPWVSVVFLWEDSVAVWFDAETEPLLEWRAGEMSVDALAPHLRVKVYDTDSEDWIDSNAFIADHFQTGPEWWDYLGR